jgi:hypothetical protein
MNHNAFALFAIGHFLIGGALIMKKRIIKESKNFAQTEII